jgi:hypothetical protein
MPSRRISIRVDASGATVYMTREAIETLVDKLKVIASADPRECFEVHLGMEFSGLDSKDNLVLPTVTYGDGLASVFASILSRDMPEDASLWPFEVTVMHVEQEGVDEASRWADS